MFKAEFMTNIIGITQIAIAIITLIFAIKIPISIMHFQRYTNLMTFYASFEFAHSYQSVINFFCDVCGRDVEKIAQNYKERFLKDFEKYKNKEIELCDILHYQRRLLNDYFFELEMCRKSSLFLKKIIKRDWTSSEAWVIKIIMYMNNAVDSDPVMKKKISCIKYDAKPEIKGMNKTLLKLYEVLKVKSSN